MDVLLKIVPITITGKEKSKRIFALLDDGSTATLINSNIVREIGAKSSKVQVSLKGIGNSEYMISSEKVNITIGNVNSSFSVKNVLVVNNLALPNQNLHKNVTNLCFVNTGIVIQPFNNSPDMIIGQDHSKLITTREFHEINADQLYVSRTLLGWAIHGYIRKPSIYQVNVCQKKSSSKPSYNLSEHDDQLDKLVKFYFELESVGVNSSQNINSADKRALEILEKTSRYVNNEWEVGLLWKNDNKTFLDGRDTALHRLQLLERKLDKDANYAKLYYSEMTRLIENGFAQEANELPTSKLRYLPHFGVQNINKPGKVRLVFDAAAKTASKSFNDLLLCGPDLLKSLPGVLMRFRQFSFAIKSDMKDMFLKIKIRAEDRDAQRFLWRQNNRIKKPKEYVMNSMLFGAKSSPCTALFIKNKNANLFSSIYPATAKSIVHNCYMDDFLDSCETRKEAYERVHQVIEINAKANWKMHSWVSNDESVLSDLICEKNNTPLVKTDFNAIIIEKVLGIQWLNSSDELSFKVNSSKVSTNLYEGLKRPTKREFLRVIMSVFDPLGFLAPFTIQSRILMQDIWSSGIGWDENLRDNEFIKWQEWLSDLELVKMCRIDRCYQIKNLQMRSAELHVFCDASEKAYATVAYWRFSLKNGDFHTSIIMAKSRVAPLKCMTIPRLELQAALMGSKIAKIIEREHDIKITRRVFWSDSVTVLRWIKREPRTFKIFVANRLSEIRENTHAKEWQWIPTRDNPADDATRLATGALNKNSRWFLGPSFLRDQESQWPKENFVNFDENADSSELKQNVTCVVASIATQLPIINSYRFSSWIRLISTVSRVFFVIDKMKKRDHTDVERLLLAEELCIKISQTTSFREELNALRKSNSVNKVSRILRLKPFVDDRDILRAEGRLTNFHDNDSLSKPIILDAKEYCTRLLIKFYHEKYYHGSNDSVLNELRQKYWILGLRQGLRNLVSNCSICKIKRAKPANPKMSALPSGRVAYRLKPFSHCGLDYFGPMLIKIGRRQEKRWGALFTCLTTRAIHIEIVHSLNSDSTIMSLKRFIARRGTPLVIYSDNGTNFRGASKELKLALKEQISDRQNINDFATINKIEWNFIPPASPHMGGAWERMIRSVKNALSVILRKHTPKEEVLLTIMAEVEHTVNSRPLTHVSLDTRDQEALTPNHFLIGSSSNEIRFGRCDAQALCSRKQWKQSQYFADCFWQRWMREYLPSLIPRQKWHESDTPVKEGDIVLILDESTERNQWRKGVVTRVFPGKDKEVRVAELRTVNGNLIRPTRKLVRFAEVQNS